MSHSTQTQSEITQAGNPFPAWNRKIWAAILAALTLFTFAVQGYHPFAEDGGLYVAGIEYTLDHSLFPHYTAFVSEHLRFSIFAPIAATAIRLTHLTLAWMLFLLDLFSIWLTLFAARQILRRTISSASRVGQAAQLAGIALLAAWWTMPVAGTSLLLMDPYVTARSFSTPLSLLAIAFALDDWRGTRPRIRSLFLCSFCLAIAFALHPLMAGYALTFVIAVRASRPVMQLKFRIGAWAGLTLIAILLCALVQLLAPAESAALQAAAVTRYYWFLSQWQWYERLGLVGPFVMIAAVLFLRRGNLSQEAMALCQACLVAGPIATLCAMLFAHESYATHLVARLQVLRVYLLLYAIMAIMLGATLYQICEELQQRAVSKAGRANLALAPAIFLAAMAAIMSYVQFQSFPQSRHLELPWQVTANPNPWVQAFLWARANTPPNALFALDAKYVNTHGEDAQTFRAISLRSALPDYSKDGGEASITPALAQQWLQGAIAQKRLSQQTDIARDANLRPFGVTWMVLHSNTVTSHPCPYDNGTVKVCKLTY